MRVRHMTVLVTAILLAALAVAGPAGAQGYTFAEGVEYEVLSTDTKDPLFIQAAEDGRIFWVEREGRIAVLHPDGTQDVVGLLEVSANACDEAWCPQEQLAPLEEGGLYSILLAPDFTESGEIYLFWSVPDSVVLGEQGQIAGNAWRDVTVCFETTCDVAGEHGVWRLAKFTLDADSHLIEGSEEPLIEVPAAWFHCCHYGGNLEFLPDGTILLSTGDDMAASVGAYGQSSDHRSGNAEQTSMNPSDRRGKVLRLNTDGTVPDGTEPGVAANPFLATDADGVALRDASGQLVTEEVEHTTIPDTWGADDGMVAFDPYVYSLGYKQPFRGTIHPYTGAAIFGEVGPDGFVPVPGRGPRGVEELNEIPAGGGVNHGWPRCSGANDPYFPFKPVNGAPSLPFVGSPSTSIEPFDCSDMEPAVLWYPHDVSERWPSLGAGGVTSAPSAFYRADNDGPLRLPAAFDDNLIFMEESRSGIIGMPMTADGHLVTDESAWTFLYAPTASPAAVFAPAASSTPARPIDATVGADGAVYLVEYSNGFYNGTASRISRLKCAGCTDAMTTSLGSSGASDQATQSAGVAVPTRLIALSAAGLGLALAIRRRRALV